MVNNFGEVLVLTTPALATAAVAGVTWWSRPGRAPANSVALGGWIPIALAALISVTIGVLAYLGHALDVSGGRALHGAVLALLASATALGAYWVLGIFVRRLVTLGGLWALSLMPLYLYALFAWLAVAGYTQCGPQAYECPL